MATETDSRSPTQRESVGCAVCSPAALSVVRFALPHLGHTTPPVLSVEAVVSFVALIAAPLGVAIAFGLRGWRFGPITRIICIPTVVIAAAIVAMLAYAFWPSQTAG